MLASKPKPNTLNFTEYNLPSNNQITPNTPTLINLLQDLTPTNFGYNFDIPDKDDVLKQFSKHYKSIEDSHQRTVQDSQYNYTFNNNTPFTLDLLSSDNVEPDTSFNDFNQVGRPLPSESSFSSDVQSCSSNNESNSTNSQSCNVHVLSAKKRERNRLAAEKCRLKKQGKITELENEKRKRMHENSILIEKIKKRTETIRKLKIFYRKLQIGELNPQPFNYRQ